MIPLNDPGILGLSQEKPVFIHPKALVETQNIGSGTRVWAFAHVCAGAEVGRDCNICDHTYVEREVHVGDRVTLKNGVHLWEGTWIEDDVFVGPNVTFTNDRRPRSRRRPIRFEGVCLRRGSSIGAGAILLPGVVVGEYALVGAGAVVTHSVPAYGLVQGNPARLVGMVCRCGKTLVESENPPHCRECLQARRGPLFEDAA